jgi:division protein CdvB (Snf7/Vps24/ESCRT-III family)
MDAISSQYGWPDSEILDLFLCRVCQIKDAIFLRQYSEMTNRHHEAEWATKTVSAFVVAASTIPQKAKEQLQKMLEAISMSDTNSDKSLPATITRQPSERTLEDIIENGSVAEALERNGSRSLSDLFQP